MWRARVLAVIAILAMTGCASSREASTPTPTTTSSTTTSTSTTTTTTAPPETTTTAPPPPPPSLVDSGAKVVVSDTGVVLPVIGREGDGLLVGTPCGYSTVVTSGTPLGGAAVVLDAGHGGDEPGAVGPNGLTERVLNLEVAKHAKAALEAAGQPTVLTRTGEYRMTLEARAQVVKALQPRAFVSIHHNAEPDGPFPKPGAEMYYQVASGDSKRLSGILYEEVVKALSQYQVAWVADTDAGAKYRKNSRGDDYYGIIRRTQGTPSVLAELGFISNPPEADMYARPDVQKVEGEAVARGILRYLTTADPGSGYTEPYPRETPAGPGGGRGPSCRDPAI